MFGRLTPVAKNILMINGVIFIAGLLLSRTLDDPFASFALRVVFSDEFAPYQFFTYMWFHGGLGHIFGNMIAVLVFAPMLEQVWGAKRFLTFYLICGIGAGVLYGAVDFFEKRPLESDYRTYMVSPSPEKFEQFYLAHRVSKEGTQMLYEFSREYSENPNDAYHIRQSKQYVEDIRNLFIDGGMIGASGAVFGILFAFAFLFPSTELFLLFPPIPIKAKYLVFFYAMYELYAQFNRAPGDNVAHLAHLSGMLIAFLLLKKWKKDSRRFY